MELLPTLKVIFGQEDVAFNATKQTLNMINYTLLIIAYVKPYLTKQTSHNGCLKRH